MTESTLRALLQRTREIRVKGWPDALDGASGQKLRERLAGGTGNPAWGLIATKGKETILQLLDVDLSKLLTAAWNKYRVLAEFADPALHPDGQTSEVALNDHTMSQTYEPSIEVTVNGLKLPPLTFTLTVGLDLKAIILTIRDGRIVSVRSGSCQGSVKLELDKMELVNEDLDEFKLPGVIDLGRGLRIPALEPVAPRPAQTAV